MARLLGINLPDNSRIEYALTLLYGVGWTNVKKILKQAEIDKDKKVSQLSEDELKKIYEEKAGKYKEIKELLIEDLEKFIAPLREKRNEIAKDIPRALEILKAGGEKAKKVASQKMDEVREKVGVKIY